MNPSTYRVQSTFSTPTYGASWRPVPMAPSRQMSAGPRPLVATRRLAQTGRVAAAADIVSGLVTGGAAIVGGIALATLVGTGDPKGTPPSPSRPAWKWIGGITAVLGAVKIFVDISKGTAGSGSA